MLAPNGTPHLFDLVQDVEEKHDLAAAETARVENLTAKWKAWNAQMPATALKGKGRGNAKAKLE